MGKRTLNRKNMKLIDGKPFWILFGAEGDEDDDNGAGGGNSGGTEDDDDEDDDDNGDADKNMDPKDIRIRDLSAEARDWRKQLRTAQKELRELKEGKEEEEGQKKAKETKATADVTKLEEKLAKRDQVLSNNLLETAILKAKDPKNKPYEWHDLQMLVSALDRGEIDIDLESGTVEGLSEELKRVAREKPFLLKSNTKSGGDGGNEQKKGSTGNNPGGAGNRQQDQRLTDRQKLIDKYKIR